MADKNPNALKRASKACPDVGLTDDYADQRGVIFGLDRFRTMFKPRWKRIFDRIHNLAPHVHVFFHSCGSVRPLIPDFIEIGVDILDPIQPVGPEMAPERLKADFGGRLCFHGGMDMQRLLPSGTREQVRAEARRYCATLGAGGGYILAPAHLFQPDVPPENILAVYAAER